MSYQMTNSTMRPETTSPATPAHSDRTDQAQSPHSSIFLFVIRAGFRILTVLFFVLGFLFLFSNTYRVSEGMVAIHSRLGKLSGIESSVKAPGGPYWAFPFPADKIVKLPTAIQKVMINRAFLFEDSSANLEKAKLRAASFQPGVHGSLITGDKNIVQGTWIVHYRIDFSSDNFQSRTNVIHFIKKIGTIQKSAEIVKVFSEQAIIRAVGAIAVSDFISGKIDHDAVKTRIQQKIDTLELGVRIVSLSASRYGPPAVLESDFQAATQAESEKALQIEKAIRYRTTTLNEVAGEQWENLLNEITMYEQAITSNNPEQQKSTHQTIENILSSSTIGGYVATQLERARTEKTKTIEKARSSVSRFTELYDAYHRDPHILKNQLFQDVLEEVFSGPFVKVYWLPPGQQIYLGALDKTQE
ncbi:MAG: hypothetical protein JW915_04435 [Chitinispirillaceae bacterium]|nr:hypothetical protein [Chitinispirillaceae bacterium]